MSAPKVVVTSPIPEPGIERLKTVADVWMWKSNAPIPRSVRDEQLAAAVGVVTTLADRVDAAFLDTAPKLKVVANVAVGYNNIDVEACTQRGVTVANTPDVLTAATADLALALLLAVTRRIGESERLVRSGADWEWGMSFMLGTSIADRQLGIVGMGAIGTAVARRAKAFGMRIAYHNRSLIDSAVAAELDAARLELDELLATSDVVSLNLPYSPGVHHLIDTAALTSMKNSAYLINTARGQIVDEAALVAALSNGTIAGAGLDVYEEEPRVHPGLLALDNVVLTPHIGSATVETRNAMAQLAADNVVAVINGSEPPTPVRS